MVTHRNDSVIFTAQVNKRISFIQEIQFWTRHRSVEQETLGLYLLLTTLIAESESIGNLIPSGKRQLQERVCIHQTVVF